MKQEMGRIEIIEQPVLVDIQTKAAEAGEPPKGRFNVGSGFFGDGGGIPPSFRDAFKGESEGDYIKGRATQVDADIFWGFHNIDPHNFPGLNEIIEKYEMQHPVDYQVSKEGLKEFLKRAKDAGLIKYPRRFNLRQYIGRFFIISSSLSDFLFCGKSAIIKKCLSPSTSLPIKSSKI